MMNDDMALVREFAASQSERAFETLVSRHVHLVYSAALRQVHDAHLAQDVTQAVFIVLASKAKSLGDKTVLSSWLYRTARFASADALKIQRRRQRREQEAHMDAAALSGQPDATWEQLSPILDEAMSHLRDRDRDAIVLRFFENKSLREVGIALGLEERAAQKRVARGLEKLRAFFTKHGVTLSAAVIAGAVSANSVQAAPAGIVTAVAATAVKGTTATASTLILVKGALKIMAWAKAKTVAVAGIIVILATGAPVVVVNQVKKHHESNIVNAFIEKPDNTFSEENDPEFRRVYQLGAEAVPYLVGAIKKYNSVRDTPPNPKSGHAEGRDLIRIRAYWGLRGLGVSAKPALPFLIEQFSSNNDLIDFDFDVLARLGPEAREAIPVLTRAFHGTDSKMRFYAARALAKIDPNNRELLPTMLADLKSSDVISRRFACLVIGELGPKATSAVPALTLALSDEDAGVRENATNALKKIKLQMPTRGDR